jgi:hypothetical protein
LIENPYRKSNINSRSNSTTVQNHIINNSYVDSPKNLERISITFADQTMALKKIYSAFFIGILIVPFLSSFLFLHWTKHEIKSEVKSFLIAGIDSVELVKLRFHANEIDQVVRWKHAKEFEYQGHMYDVLSYCIEGEYIIYTLWPDTKESKLNKQLNDLIAGQLNKNPLNKKNQKNMMDFMQKMFFENEILDIQVPGFHDFLFCTLQESYSIPYIHSDFKPPQSIYI